MNHLLLQRQNFVPREEDFALLPDGVADLVFCAPPFSREYGASEASMPEGAEGVTQETFTELVRELARLGRRDCFLYMVFDGTSILHFASLFLPAWEPRNILVWDKGVSQPEERTFAREQDLLLFATKGGPKMMGEKSLDIIEAERSTNYNKPHVLPERCLLSSLGGGSGRVALDPIARSGSLSLAAEGVGASSVSLFATEAELHSAKARIRDAGGKTWDSPADWLQALEK